MAFQPQPYGPNQLYPFNQPYPPNQPYNPNEPYPTLYYNYPQPEPSVHRRAKRPISNCGALIRAIKSMQIIGVFAMPMAFYNTGWVTAIIGSFIIGFVVVYCLQIVMRDFYEIVRREPATWLSYPEAVKLGFSRGPGILRCCSGCMSGLLEFLLITYHFILCTVYVVFMADLINNLVSSVHEDLGNRTYVSLLFVPLLMVFFIQDLRYLVRIAFVSTLFIFTAIGVVIYQVFKGDFKKQDELSLIQENFSNHALALGTLIFSMSAVGMILLVESKMKSPASFTPHRDVLTGSMVFVLFLTGIVGLLGYLRFGAEVAPDVLTNLPSTDTICVAMKVLVGVALLFTYPLFRYPLRGYVPFDILGHRKLIVYFDAGNHLLGDLLVRYLIIMSSIFLGLLIPNVTLIISFGCLNLTMISMVYPALLRIAVFYEIGYGCCNRRLIEAILLFIFGIIVGLVPTIVSVVEAIG